jgi:hypothetical protein
MSALLTLNKELQTVSKVNSGTFDYRPELIVTGGGFEMKNAGGAMLWINSVRLQKHTEMESKTGQRCSAADERLPT